MPGLTPMPTYGNFSASTFPLSLLPILLFCVGLLGCDNFCFVGVSDPGGGGAVAAGGTSCPVNNQTGNVALQLESSFTPAASSGPTDVQHIFVSLRGIEALPTQPAGGDPPAWQELAPELVARPTQVDLMARPANACGPSTFPGAVVNAGVYTQVRLLLVTNQPEASEPVPTENACVPVGFNCVAATNGSLQLLSSDDPAELQIPTQSIAGGFFRVLPGDHIRLAIEFEPRASFILPAGSAGRIVPSFSVTQQSSCESAR
jgi:hypothetical protein